MPLRSFFQKKEKPIQMTAKEKKSKLALKQMQAHQTPEQHYDLIGCGLTDVPDSTFVMCKILLKTSLLLCDNELTRLDGGGSLADLGGLQVLDLTNNCLSKIPDTIGKLTNLRILKLGDNLLKSLPSSLSLCENLQELYLSSNKLTKVPTSICALPKLHVLTLDGNNIAKLPYDLCALQKCLHTLELNTEILKEPPQEVAEDGIESIMKYLCEKKGVEYEGLDEEISTAVLDDTAAAEEKGPSTVLPDEFLVDYMKKKDAQKKAQLCEEMRHLSEEQEYIETMLKDSTNNKEAILHELNKVPIEAKEYERAKLVKMREHMSIEENLKSEEEEHLKCHVMYNSNKEKEALLEDLNKQEKALEEEVGQIVEAKEKERGRLLEDLATSEQEMTKIVKDLLEINMKKRDKEFILLLQEQESQIQTLLTGVSEAASELKREEVALAMEKFMMEELQLLQLRAALDEKQAANITALLEDADMIECHLEGVMMEKAVGQQKMAEALLEDEEYQEAAFKLLFLKNDLQRSNILQQICQVEYELARLTSFERRKIKYGVHYGSTEMLEQRTTLVSLLKKLLGARDEREAQLEDWIHRLQEERTNYSDPDDYWLVQYKRLMALKPDGIVAAEQELESSVCQVLELAHALDQVPVFARHQITFDILMEMEEEDYEACGLGPVVQHSIQRALHTYLAQKKLGPQEPSAPEQEEELESDEEPAPSAPPTEDSESYLVEEEGASAPPLDKQFVESECVVCLNAQCRVVFLPCGHVCACLSCCQPLTSCPLCRADITQKILLSS